MLKGVGLGIALSSFVLSLACVASDAVAQSGSVGGQIGKDNKSISGTGSAPRSVEPQSPATVRKPRAEPSSRASRSDGGGSSGSGAGSFDGAWTVLATGSPCGSSSESVVVSGGRLAGDLGTSGQVSPNGATSGQGSASGLSWTTSGRFSGRSGSGTFSRSDGCRGSWTASKK